MKNKVFVNSVRFIALILLQVTFFDHMNVAGYINPLPYVLFIIALPFNTHKSLALLLAFLLGLTMDVFSTSGGIHAAACTVVAYLRPLFLRFAFGISFEYQSLKLSGVPFKQRLVYMSLVIAVHHTVLFLLEVFNFSSILYVLQKTFFTGILTLFLCLLIQIIFSAKQQ